MIHRISRIDNRIGSDGELLIECFGDVEIYLTAEQFKEVAGVFAAAELRRDLPRITALEAENQRLRKKEDRLNALIDRVEGVLGWATCRNGRGERLKDDPVYVAAYLASRAALTTPSYTQGEQA